METKEAIYSLGERRTKMQTEKQRERLVELIKNADNDKNLGWYDLYDLCSEDGCCAEYFADYLMSNNVVVLPENALVEVKPRIVYEDKASAIIEEEYVITWENKRTLLKEKEKQNENHTMRND